MNQVKWSRHPNQRLILMSVKTMQSLIICATLYVSLLIGTYFSPILATVLSANLN